MEKQKENGLRSPELLRKHPSIGIVMFIFGALVFIILALNLVYNGPLIKWDLALAESFHDSALKGSPLVVNIMIGGYYLGKEVLIAISLFLFIYFLIKRFWREVAMVAIGVWGSTLIFLSLCYTFVRERPFNSFTETIWSNGPDIPGFPSGHTLTAIIFFGLLAYLLVPRIKSRIEKALVVFLAIFAVVYIGVSRLYLGDHYLTDILAGYAVGIAWFGLSYTLIERFFHKRELKKEKNKSHEK